MDDFIFGLLNTEESRAASLKARRGGVSHAQTRHPRDPLPGQPVAIELTIGPAQPHDAGWVYWTNDGSDPQGKHGQAGNGYAVRLEMTDVEWDTFMWGYVRRLRGAIPGQPAGTVVRYRVAAGGSGAETLADGGAYYAYFVDDDPAPDWTQDAIIYQVFADRFFSTAEDFPRVEAKPSHKANGTLAGITARLDHIAGLGANCLWLTPIFPSPSYHGYDALDFYDINPRLGTKDDFRQLIDAAHSRGIRVLMDFVPNHWSNEHPTFEAARRDQASQYIPWYTFDSWPDGYKTFFGVKTLPQINLRYGPARQHVLEAARHWLDFGVDGYRVDYCIGPTPDFYADFRRVTRAAKPGCWTFGEAIDTPDAQLAFEGGLDGALDFILLEALRQTFAYGQWNAARFTDFLDRHEAYFPPGFSRPSFLDNHDMNRFLWVAQGDVRKLKLAALCQFSLAGAPVIYYGTEVGLSQERDVRQGGWAIHEEARLPMLWGSQQDHALLSFYSGLCHVRTREPALRRGSQQSLAAPDGLLALRRVHAEGNVVCVLNLTGQARDDILDIPERSVLCATDDDCRAQVGGGSLRLHLPAFGGVMLKA